MLPSLKTRLLWLDPACSWIRHHALHSTEAAACQHGLDYRKSWLFVSNLSALESLASTCVHPPGAHVITSGRRSAQGTFLTRDTACYPASLCKAMAEHFRPLLSSHIGEIPFLSWHSLLPPALFWPIPSHRVEDGAGTCSSACWSAPSGSDYFRDIRRAWTSRILSGDFLQPFRARLSSGSKSPPISDSDLTPFLEDLRSFMKLSSSDFDLLLRVPEGLLSGCPPSYCRRPGSPLSGLASGGRPSWR